MTTAHLRDGAVTTPASARMRRALMLVSVSFLALMLVAPALAHAAYESTTNVAGDTASAKKWLALSSTYAAWVDYRDGHAEIYVADLATGAERRITSSAGDKKLPVVDMYRVIWLEQNLSATGSPYVPHYYNLKSDYETVITQLDGRSAAADTTDCFRVALIGDTVAWEMNIWGWSSTDTWSPQTSMRSLVNPAPIFLGYPYWFGYPSSVEARTASADDLQGWAGYDSASGRNGVWITKKPALVASPVKTTMSIQPGWARNPFALSLSASGPSGIAQTFYQVSTPSSSVATQTYTGPFTYDTMPSGYVPYSGPVTIAYYSRGNDGTLEPARYVTFGSHGSAAPVTTSRCWVPPSDATNPYSDTAVPGVPSPTVATSWIGVERSTKDALVELKATDAAADTIIQYTVDGGPLKKALGNYGAVITIPRNQEKTFRLEWSARDVVGNTEPTQTAYATVDLYAPTTTVTFARGWQKASVTVTMTATDSMSGVRTTYYRTSTDNGLNWSSDKTYSAPFQVTAAGTTLLQSWSVDNAGHVEAKKQDSVQIDLQAPVTTVDRLVADQVIKSGYSIGFSASDNVAVAGTWYRINGGTPHYSSKWWNMWPSDQGQDTVEGLNTLEYWSVDTAGNAEAVQSMRFTADFTAPVVTTNIPKYWPYYPYTVELSATDAGTGVKDIYYQIAKPKGGGVGPLTRYTGPFSITTTSAVNFYAVDNAGNQGLTQSLPKAFGANHETTTPFDSCQGGACHQTSLVDDHPACNKCHVNGSLIAHTKDCEGCHGPVDHTYAKHVDWLDSRCTSCHDGNLAAEHVYRRGVACQGCHAPKAGSLVANGPTAAAFGQEDCSACHRSWHGLRTNASTPASIALDPSFAWSSPQDGSLFENESWFPAAAKGAGARTVVSDRRDVSPDAAWATFSTAMIARGWKLSGGSPDTSAGHFSATFTCNGQRAVMVLSAGRGHNDAAVPGLGSRVEIVWWDTLH